MKTMPYKDVPAGVPFIFGEIGKARRWMKLAQSVTTEVPDFSKPYEVGQPQATTQIVSTCVSLEDGTIGRPCYDSQECLVIPLPDLEVKFGQ